MADRFDAIIGKARQLCNPQADKMMDGMKGTMSEGRMMNVPLDKPDYSYGGFDDEMLVEGGGQPQIPMYNPTGPNHTRMPKQIIEEMRNNPIMESSELPQLDELADKYAKMNVSRKQVQPSQSNVGGIDYSVLRAIINECIDTKLREYLGGGRQNLNENTLTGIKLSDGKIKLVDNSGRVFSAKLEYNGKVKGK